MIRTQQEYEEALRRHQRDREVIEMQQQELSQQGFTEEEIARVMEPLLTFRDQLTEEIFWYEGVQRHTIPPTKRLTEIGRLLIAARIASGLNQRQLAKCLGVSEAQVSRDERNEYHGITMERAQRIFDVLGFNPVTNVEKSSSPPQTVEQKQEAVACV